MTNRRPSITRFQLLDVLRKEVARDGSQTATAKRFGVTKAYLSDVLSGRRDPGPKILEPLHYAKVPLPALRYRRMT